MSANCADEENLSRFAAPGREPRINTDKHGFQLPEENLLDLFDGPTEPLGVIRQMSDFLETRAKHMQQSGKTARDVIIYHIGHGGFTSGNSEYYIALKATQKQFLDDSALRITSLSRTLREHARYLRLFLILDCCFAAAAVRHFQMSEIANAIVCQTQEAFPEKGIALLCASSRSTPAEIDEHRGYTMFSGALLEVLKSGDPEGDSRISLFQVGALIRSTLNKRYQGNAARPEVHSPSQKHGDVAILPLFPNLAVVRKPCILFFDSILNYIITSPIVLLFSQEGMTQSVRYLLDEVQIHFGKNNVIHLEPLSDDAIQPSEYFSDLSDQCHLMETTTNGYAFA